MSRRLPRHPFSLATRNVASAAALGGLLLLPLLILVALRSGRRELVDDAYITFRYVNNLIAGQGLVFNAQEHVEGLSNVLWALLLVPSTAFGYDIERVSYWLGLGFAAAAFVEALRASYDESGRSRYAALAAGLALAGFANYWLSAATGLETGLVAFLVTHGYTALLKGRTPTIAVSGFFAVLTRPEMAGIFALLFACALVMRIRSSAASPYRTSMIALHALVWAAGVATIVAVRFWYFGEFVPNSLIAKSVSLDMLGLRGVYYNLLNGLGYAISFVAQYPIVFVVLLVAPFFRAAAIASLLFGAECFVSVINGGDWMPHTRLLSPFAPIIAIAFAGFVDRLVEFLGGQSAAMRRIARAWGIVIVLGGIVASVSAELARPTNSYRDIACHRRIADELAPYLTAQDKLTPEQLGMMSWRLRDIYFHDMIGLTDRHVARHGTEYIATFGKTDFRYTLNVVKPAAIIVHSGFAHLERMNVASGDVVRANYAIFAVPVDGLCRSTQMIAVRRDRLDALMPALKSLGGSVVNLP